MTLQAAARIARISSSWYVGTARAYPQRRNPELCSTEYR